MEALAEYNARLAKWRAIEHAEKQRYNSVGNLRLAVMILAIVIAWFSAFRELISAWWLLLPAAIFLALVVWHEYISGHLRRAARAIQFYQRGLARLSDKWRGTGNSGERFIDPSHLFAGDVDLFGKGSLFELLTTARTTAGESTLAAWLASRDLPTPDLARRRQEAVTELSTLLDLREDLAVIGDDVRGSASENTLAMWAAAPPVAFPVGYKLMLYGAPLFVIASGVLWMRDITGVRVFLLAAFSALAAAWRLGPAASQVFRDVEQPARELGILSQLLERIERDSWRAPRLVQLAADLETGGMPASKAIAALQSLLDRRAWAHNMFLQLPARLMLWDEHHAVLIESWRRRWGAAVGRWLAAIGEMEALCSLSAFMLENPDASFPEFVTAAEFDATSLRHPLLSRANSVANDIHLGGESARLWIISGSNMSGKSTLLRAVALNAVLAWCGAPVLATRLRISPVAIGASIRVLDSLQDGRSLFYAEITRLRKILDLTSGPVPALFLIDELLHGTNSHDRRIGAEAVLRSLIDRGAIGLVTTHDLALAGIADSLTPRAANLHFEDQIHDGVVEFDYRLRPGIVERSNALELMRAVGLIP